MDAKNAGGFNDLPGRVLWGNAGIDQVLRRGGMRIGRRCGVGRVAIGLGFLAACLAAAPPPVVPGYVRVRNEAKLSAAEQGQVLLGELNCTQCHAAPAAKRVIHRGAPDLSDIGARATPQYLKDYLSNPHGMKPGTAMPDLFHASDPQAKQGAIDFLVQYLVSLGGPMKPASEAGNDLLVEQGQRLFHRVGCVACHAPEKNAATTIPSLPLPNLAEKTTVDQLQAFLLDPFKVRPDSRMPNLGLSRDEAHAIAVYLLRDQMSNPQAANAGPSHLPGLEYEYSLGEPPNASIEEIGKRKPESKGRVDRFTLNIPHRRNDNFAIKFTGAISIPKDGKYTFYTSSDDGSRLYLDGKLIVDNDGVHPSTEKVGEAQLSAGDHPIIVTYYQAGGEQELKVEWAGPGINRQEIPADVLFSVGGKPMIPLKSEPFTLDPRLIPTGRQMFAVIGCASCHAMPNVQSMRQSKPLADLDPESDTGCLGTHLSREVPQYDLSADQRAALKAALKDQASLDRPFEPTQQVVHTMAAMNCYACHNRDGVGGPTADRQPYFVMTSEFDMGDEGRIPPRLSHVGEKLRADAMEQIIFEGKLHIRPVLATRMPMFSKAAIGGVVDAFQRADSTGAVPPPAFSEQSVKDGRTLVGTKGMGCVNCHGVNGTKSLGMPGPDLSPTTQRMKFGWFAKWLDNPPAAVPGTRMPQFWVNHESPLKDLAGGTEASQVAAIWNYLSQGKSMALPIGLIPTGGYELIPSDIPIVHRTFMAGVGPRAILVGFPEMVHVAFDANGVRMAKAWRGRFFDASGMWEGRGGNWLGPLGTDVIDMPPGPSFAVLASQSDAWPKVPEPVVNEKFRNVGGRFKGYVLDKQERPTFHYILDDTIDIHEQPIPLLRQRSAALIRKFEVSGAKPVKGLYFEAAAGKSIEQKSPGAWTIDGKLTVKLSSKSMLHPAVRESEGSKQLLIPIDPNNGPVSFEVEMSW